ncbi:MAG: metallophosphoesterase [Alistipes sp.]|nr:metallophosphoesterase [Alistipes sp.]
MLLVGISILALLLVVADGFAYRWYVRPIPYSWVRVVVVSAMVVVNLMPYVAASMLWFFNTGDMVPMMWILTLYTILSLSRLSLYVVILPFRNYRHKWHLGIVLCTIVAMVQMVGVVHTRKALTVRSVEVASMRLPEGFDGYRIAFFSDLHLGSLTSAEEMCRNLVERINSLDADLVLFGGDLVNAHYEELRPEISAILRQIEARDGVMAVMGNHDTGVYVKDTITLPIATSTRLVTERIEQMGWRVANDETELLVRGNDTITLTGIGFSRELLEHRHSADVADELDLRPIFEDVPRDKFNIAVSHMPQLWRKVKALGYGDLMLSGHVHAMQMKVAFAGWQISPAQLMYEEWSGLYKEDSHHLYITDGVGSVGFHMRIGAPPEITLLTLRRR